MARKKYFLELQKTTDFSAFLEFFHNHKVRRLDEKYNIKKSKGYENSLLPLVLFFFGVTSHYLVRLSVYSSGHLWSHNNELPSDWLTPRGAIVGPCPTGRTRQHGLRGPLLRHWVAKVSHKGVKGLAIPVRTSYPLSGLERPGSG